MALYRNSLAETGEDDWTCAVCAFENRPRLKTCSLCGTSREVAVALAMRWGLDERNSLVMGTAAAAASSSTIILSTATARSVDGKEEEEEGEKKRKNSSSSSSSNRSRSSSAAAVSLPAAEVMIGDEIGMEEEGEERRTQRSMSLNISINHDHQDTTTGASSSGQPCGDKRRNEGLRGGGSDADLAEGLIGLSPSARVMALGARRMNQLTLR